MRSILQTLLVCIAFAAMFFGSEALLNYETRLGTFKPDFKSNTTTAKLHAPLLCSGAFELRFRLKNPASKELRCDYGLVLPPRGYYCKGLKIAPITWIREIQRKSESTEIFRMPEDYPYNSDVSSEELHSFPVSRGENLTLKIQASRDLEPLSNYDPYFSVNVRPKSENNCQSNIFWGMILSGLLMAGSAIILLCKVIHALWTRIFSNPS